MERDGDQWKEKKNRRWGRRILTEVKIGDSDRIRDLSERGGARQRN